MENTPSVSSLSTPESPPNSEPPSAVEAERQTAIADLTARALDLWPDTVRLEARIAEAVDLSPAQARLAIELAQLRDADGWGYVASTMTRWHASGYDDLDCEAEVRAARPKPLKINAAATAQPTFSPPKDEAPTDDEIADTIQAIRDARTPMERKLYLGLLRGHVTRGLVPATVLAEFEERNAR